MSQKLNIVVIRSDELSVNLIKQVPVHTFLNKVILSDSSNLFPFSFVSVFLNENRIVTVLIPITRKVTDGELLQKKLFEEFYDAFQSQPPMRKRAV